MTETGQPALVVAHLTMTNTTIPDAVTEKARKYADETRKEYEARSAQYHLKGRKTGYQFEGVRMEAYHLVGLMEQALQARAILRALEASLKTAKVRA